MKFLCTICARRGSKGLKNKNFLPIKKKPLFSYSADLAKKSNCFSDIVISSDNIKPIKKYYNSKNFIFLKRPKKLSGDKIAKIHVIRHALKASEKKLKKKYDYILDLDITSPLRNMRDLKTAIKIFFQKKSDNLITLTNAKKNPYFNMVEIINKQLSISKKLNKTINSRQQAPRVYEMNASIYIWKRQKLINSNSILNKKTSFYEMPYERSIDIDDFFDFKIVRSLINNKL